MTNIRQSVGNGSNHHSDLETGLNRWWNGEIPNNVVAAYHAGRLTNQLFWDAQQCYLLADRHRYRILGDLLNQLFLLSYELAADPTKTIEPQIRNVSLRLSEDLRGERAAEAWEAANDALDTKKALAYGYEQTSRADASNSLVKCWILPIIEELREIICASHSPEQKWAFALGDSVDQTIRRPDVYKFMWQPLPLDVELENWELGHRSAGCEPTNRIANFSPVPGSLRPESGWRERIQILCAKIPIPSSVVSILKNAPKGATGWELITTLDAFDKELRRHFDTAKVSNSKSQQDWYLPHDTKPPNEYGFGPLVGSKKDLAKWTLHGECDHRALETAVHAGRLWVKKITRYRFEIWFDTEDKFRRAKEKSEGKF